MWIDYTAAMKTAPLRKKNPAAIALGRLGGSANTKAQNRARKANAQFAGRPRRICVHCGEPVLGGHVDRTRDATCGAHGWRWQKQSEPDAPARRPLPLVVAAQQADAYLRHAVATGTPIDIDAVPLLRLRAALAGVK